MACSCFVLSTFGGSLLTQVGTKNTSWVNIYIIAHFYHIQCIFQKIFANKKDPDGFLRRHLSLYPTFHTVFESC